MYKFAVKARLRRVAKQPPKAVRSIMKIMCGLLLLLSVASKAGAWGGTAHEMIIQESLKDVAREWGLDKPVTVTPFDDFLQKLAKENPRIQTRGDFAKWLRINPDSPFDKPSKRETIGAAVTPYQILGFYAPRSDDTRDVNLPYDKGEQFWFGSGTKTSSQAFRHMEKPPFDLLHPLNSAGFPLGTIGQASERAQIYFDLALLVHRVGEPYWAWNFLGCAFHYLEDLGQPYHSAQLLPPMAWHGLLAYLKWGWRADFGFIKTVTHVAANLHHYFEGYVDAFLEAPDHKAATHKTAALWKTALRGRDVLDTRVPVQTLAKNDRNLSNRFVFESVQATLLMTDKTLLGPRTYQIQDEEHEHAEDPSLYFNPDGSARVVAASQIATLVQTLFKNQGTVVRTTVRQFLEKTGENP